MALTIDELQIEIQQKSTSAASGIDALSASLTRLRSSVKGGAGLTTATKQFQAFAQAVQTMQAPTQKIAELVTALKPLENIGKSNLGSALNQLKKIPQITDNLDDAKLTAFATKIQQVTVAIRPLAAEMEKVSNGFSKLPANIQKAINANAKLTTSNKKVGSSYGVMGTGIKQWVAKFGIAYIAARRVATVISKWITESNNYVENLNLFTVSMGEYAAEAQKYAEQVGEIMGIDPSQWMRNQGVLMTLATGFGVVSDRAYIMSKNLTQLGYDISSFFNISYEESMQKLQSGISGELEPLRRLGYDLSQAKLNAVALSLGIDQSVQSMSQAEKAELRYYAIMTQVTTAQGDMARTLSAPANQMRIFQAAATQAGRALGNTFIPMLNAVLPYAIAFLKVIRWVAQEIANLFGFSLPEVDYSGLNALGGVAEGAEDVSDALNDATGSAKELKKQLFGFDELNVLQEPSAGGAAGAGGVGALGGGFDFKLPEYDFLGGAIDSKVNEIVQKIKDSLGTIELILLGASFAVGAVLAFTGVNIPLGVGLMAAGMVGMAAKLIDSSGLFNEVSGGIQRISALLGISSFAIGAILAFTGVNIPLGIGLMVAGMVGVAASIDWGALLKKLKEVWHSIDLFFTQTIPQFWNDKIAPWFTREKWDGITENIKTSIITAWNNTVSKWGTSISNWWSNDVQSWFAEDKWRNLGGGAIGELWDGIKGKWEDLKSWWSTLKLDGFKIRIPSLQLNWDAVDNVVARFFGVTAIPRLSLSWIDAYANGGFPTTGQLFIANEAGPELVGQVGGRTTVTNQDQFTQGLADANMNVVNAVYAMANMVVRAINDKDTGTYLDGMELAKGMYRYNNQVDNIHGKSLVNA